MSQKHIVLTGQAALRCTICGVTRHFEQVSQLDQVDKNATYLERGCTHRRRFEIEHAHAPKAAPRRFTIAIADLDAELEPIDRLLTATR